MTFNQDDIPTFREQVAAFLMQVRFPPFLISLYCLISHVSNASCDGNATNVELPQLPTFDDIRILLLIARPVDKALNSECRPGDILANEVASHLPAHLLKHVSCRVDCANWSYRDHSKNTLFAGTLRPWQS